jgi:hypothetical protein
MSRLAVPNRVIATAAIIAVATWLIGWWAVPVVGLIAGLAHASPRGVAGAASLAWAALLAVDVMSASFAHLTGILSGIMGIPGLALIILTIVFPALLGWSAATIGTAIRSARPPGSEVQHSNRA